MKFSFEMKYFQQFEVVVCCGLTTSTALPIEVEVRGDRRCKYGCFFGKVLKGEGGVIISDPKNYIADFVGFKAIYFGSKFWKKCPKRGGKGAQSGPILNIK